MGVRYNVIIPVVSHDLAALLLDSIAANTILPDNVLIIDNSRGTNPYPLNAKVPLTVIKPGKPLGVNESWNLGVSLTGDCDYLAILNDDVILGKHFFERNIDVFLQRPECCVVCPATVYDVAALRPGGTGKIVPMKRREGWAMSFRWEILKRLPPIPAELTTFCGDDWLWVQTRVKGWWWYQDTGNIVYHRVGGAVRKLGVRGHLKRDKAALGRLLS